MSCYDDAFRERKVTAAQLRPSGDARQSRLPLVVLVLPLLLGAVADADESQATVLGVEAAPCPVRLIVAEHACPGCGLGRATALAVQGQWERSWIVHPAGIMVAALCALGIAVRLSLRFARRSADAGDALLRHGHHIFVLGILAAWIVRLVR